MYHMAAHTVVHKIIWMVKLPAHQKSCVTNGLNMGVRYQVPPVLAKR